ncbi:MAG: hypothetical protein HY592_00125 [Candidatus Omnitrophica bacterium]|nr:hypothetical protein [Candidatus Omnitrophota bacterium]
MNFLKGFVATSLASLVLFSGSVLMAGGQDYSGGQEDPNKKILKQGLLGAGTGAIASSASGGDAGKGALIGAGTNVIGGALLDTLTAPAPQQQQPQQVQYAQAAPTQYASYPVQAQTTYQPVEQAPVYVQQQPRTNPNNAILKSALLGAGTGAIASSASGGKAGKGALIGAGTSVIGGALLDSLTGSGQSQPQAQPVYYQPAPQYAPQQASVSQPRKKIVRQYDKDGNVVSETEVWE